MDPGPAGDGGEGMTLFQVVGFMTAPQGNVTAASHRYVANASVPPNVPERHKRGEAEQA